MTYDGFYNVDTSRQGFCNHRPDFDRYMNIICVRCSKIFARGQERVPDYIQHRTDEDRNI